MSRAIESVLFDLDGTLLDTAPDMGRALNHVLRAHKQKEKTPAEVRPHVSRGGLALICFGFDLTPESARAQELCKEMLRFYAANICEGTTLFDGMESLLHYLESRNMPWGIVTNKPGHLTEPLLRALQLDTRAACVVSGDTLPQRKPDPAPMFYACEQIPTAAETCIYVGDDRRDIDAGRAAGMQTLAAAYGYIAPGEQIADWRADGIVNHVAEIQTWIESHNA